jgi:hypothetical protein
MNKITKIALIMYVLNFIVIITLMLLSQKIPEFLIKYTFWGAIILSFSGIIGNKKNQSL